ncbi:MAG TPA: glycosyltransferase, partial [Oceanipulchritudo sp.]|nr:glycosyltransferase [Oceanipulchritudo sp.]
ESIRDLVTSRGVEVPVSVVPTGINLKTFASGDGIAFRNAHGIPAGAPVLGHIGRIEREKNVEFLAKAVGLALQRDPTCWFLLAGEGECKEVVRRILAAAGVVGRTLLLGRLKGPDFAGAYKAMDVFLFCSKSETQGMVLAEAMAAGRPVIALDAPGAREIVCHEKNGYLLQEGASIETYADAIARWRKLPDRVRREWESEIARTAEAFSLDHCMSKLERVYEELLHGHSIETNLSPWEQLMGRFEAEWELALEKAKAATVALTNQSKGE